MPRKTAKSGTQVEGSRIGRKRELALAKDENEDYKARRADLVKVAATVFNELGYESTTL